MALAAAGAALTFYQYGDQVITSAADLVRSVIAPKHVDREGAEKKFTCVLAPSFEGVHNPETVPDDVKIMVGFINKYLSIKLSSLNSFEAVQREFVTSLGIVTRPETHDAEQVSNSLILTEEGFAKWTGDAGDAAFELKAAAELQRFLQTKLKAELCQASGLNDPEVLRGIVAMTRQQSAFFSTTISDSRVMFDLGLLRYPSAEPGKQKFELAHIKLSVYTKEVTRVITGSREIGILLSCTFQNFVPASDIIASDTMARHRENSLKQYELYLESLPGPHQAAKHNDTAKDIDALWDKDADPDAAAKQLHDKNQSKAAARHEHDQAAHESHKHLESVMHGLSRESAKSPAEAAKQADNLWA